MPRAQPRNHDLPFRAKASHAKISQFMAFHAPSVAFIFIFTAFLIIPVAHSIPFIALHGIGGYCEKKSFKEFTELLRNSSGAPGFCLEIGNGSWDSWFMPIEKQIKIACDKVTQIEELSKGYNIVGESQGNIIARGLIQFCDGGPPVKNYVSLGGPQAGIASIPLCGSGPLCKAVDDLIKKDLYSEFVQDHLAPSGYLKIPSDIPRYLNNCKLLPRLNNELPDERNSTYKERFSSLQNLVLIMSENDKVLVPKETSWFGFYSDGSWDKVLPVQQTKLYIEDWIGLRTLDEAGKVRFINVAGPHTSPSVDDIKKYVVPYLVGQA